MSILGVEGHFTSLDIDQSLPASESWAEGIAVVVPVEIQNK